MRWDDFRRSDNVEDRREDGGYCGGGGFSMPGGRGGLGIGTIVVLGLVGWALGIDPRLLIGGAEILTGGSARSSPSDAPSRSRHARPAPRAIRSASSSRPCWATPRIAGRISSQRSSQHYRAPRLVMFSGVTDQPCGGQAQSPPWVRSIARATSASIIDTVVLQRPRDGASAAAAARHASSPRPM